MKFKGYSITLCIYLQCTSLLKVINIYSPHLMLVRHHPEFSELPPHLIELSVWRKTSMAPISPCVRTYTLQGYPSLCIINSQFQQKVSLHGNFHSVITGLMNFFSHFSDQFNYSYQLMECFNFEWTYCCRLHLF